MLLEIGLFRKTKQNRTKQNQKKKKRRKKRRKEKKRNEHCIKSGLSQFLFLQQKM